MSGNKVLHADEPFGVFSADRLSTIRYRVAKFLRKDPANVYVEVQAQGTRVVPFQINPNPPYVRQSPEEAAYRPPPDQYT